MLVFTQDLVLLLRSKQCLTFYFRLHVASCMNDEDFECIERFVVLLYDITSPCISVNECCKFLFTKKCRTVEIIPPAKAVLEGLEQYIKRATLQKR